MYHVRVRFDYEYIICNVDAECRFMRISYLGVPYGISRESVCLLLMIAHTNTSIMHYALCSNSGISLQAWPIFTLHFLLSKLFPLSSHPCKRVNVITLETRNTSMVQRSVKFIKNLIVLGKPDDNDKLESI